MADDEIQVAAPAKVNLYLHVTGRRPDGYHLLDSLVVFAGIGDTVAVSKADGLILTVDGPFADAVPTDESNLVLRAAEILAERAKMAPQARIRLTKNLPVAAGIGGGSADAAAALIALSRLWGLQAGADTMAGLAIRLGADVPVCLARRPSQIGGIGEIIEPAESLPDAWLVLVNAGVAVSTPAVFRGRSGAFSNPRRIAESPSSTMDLAVQLAGRRNDLTAAARDLEPIIGDVAAALAATDDCLLARMSGSGGTCFGLFAREKTARAAAAGISAAHPDWWVVAAPMLSAAAGTGTI